MSTAPLKLVGTEAARNAAPGSAPTRKARRDHETICRLGDYRVEELGRAAFSKAFMAAPVVDSDGRMSMREVTDAGGQLRLADPVDPTEVVKLGDELFGSTLTDVFFLDRRPNRDRIAFSYELADGRYGTAVATLCA